MKLRPVEPLSGFFDSFETFEQVCHRVSLSRCSCCTRGRSSSSSNRAVKWRSTGAS